jgi:hypothetical protein
LFRPERGCGGDDELGLVQDLAQRFADGRLSTKKLLEADDEGLAQMLIEVRGIGRVGANRFDARPSSNNTGGSGLVGPTVL